MFRFIKKRKYFIIAGIILAVVLTYGGNRIYKSIFVSNNNIYGAVTHTSDSSTPGYVVANGITKVAVNNPYIIQGDDGNYYLFGTKGIRVPSEDEKNKLEYYISSDGVAWYGPSTYTINNIPAGYSLPISPKVYYINDSYYLLFTLIKMEEGQSYNPYDSGTTSSVYYAVAKNLNGKTVWDYKDEVPFGNPVEISNFQSGDTSLINYNHMNGSLLVDDKNFDGVISDNEGVYFYYHLEATQESYGIKLKADNGVLSYDDSTIPNKLLSKDSIKADIIDDPYVVFDDGEYKLFCSTKEKNNYTYNVIQANSKSKSALMDFDVVDNDLVSTRHSGGLSIFQTKIKDVVGGVTKYYADNYYVFHRNTEDVIDSNLSVANQTSFFVRKDIKNENGNAIIPRFSGQKLLENTDYYRNSISKEKYTINGKSAVGYKLPENTSDNTQLNIEFNSRMMVREILIYTNSYSSASARVVPDINVGTISPQISVRSKSDGSWTSYYTASNYGGVIRILLPLMINNTSTAEYAKNLQIVFKTDVGKINDIQIIGITNTRDEYDNYFYVKYDTKGAGVTVIDGTDCTDKLIKSTEPFTTTCKVSKANYDFTYTPSKDEYYNKILTDDYAFDYMLKPTIYHVNYDINGGDDTTAPKEVKYAIEVPSNDDAYKDVILYSNYTLPTPSRIGYSFVNWINKDTNAAFAAKTITGGTGFKNYELQASWKPLSYKVTYNSNKPSTVTWNTSWGTTTAKSSTFNYDDPYVHQDISLAGYAFAGWYTEDGSLIKNGDIVKITEPITLYAHWIKGEYKISFNLNDGTGSTKAVAKDSIADRTVIYNQEYGTLPTVTREGYTFSKWVIDDPATGTEVKSTTKTIEGDHTLYAIWTPNKITVTYDANSGSCSTASNQQTFNSKYVSLPTPTKTGYTFLGWYTSKDGGVNINTETVVTNSNAHTLYAMWAPNQYTITLNLNKGSGSTDPVLENTTVTVTYDSTYEVLKTEPTRDGYTFVGWFTDASTGTEYKSTDKVAITKALTLYAHWTANKYNVTIDYQNGSAVNVIEMNFDTVYSKTNFVAPTRENYTSQGWFDASVGGNKITPGTSKLVINKDHTIYLQWRGVPQKITYNYNGGKVGSTTSTSIQSYYQENYVLPEENPSIVGMKFIGWYTDPTAGFQITSSTKFNGTAAQTLYAHYENANYKVTFNSNGGSQVDPREYAYNTEYGELPTPTKTGYNFDGWWTTSTFDTNTQILPTSIVTIKQDSTFFAKWSAIGVKVNYDKNDGSELTSRTQYYGSEYDHPSASRTGYTFEGWYTEPTGGTKIDGSVVIDFLEERTLYAHWTPNQYTITLNLNKGSGSTDPVLENTTVSVIYDSTYEVLKTEPTRDGYTFVGWFTDASTGTEYKSTDKVAITKALTLYAHWTPNTYIVSFDTNGGEPIDDKLELTFDRLYYNISLPTPKRTGYTFEGWYDENNKKVNDTKLSSSLCSISPNAILQGCPSANIAHDNTLVAKWTPLTYTVTLDYDGGTFSTSSIKVEYDSKYLNLPTNGTKEGFRFKGWKDKDGNVVTNDTIMKTADNHTLYAQWGPETYKVTFESNGGTIIPAKDYVYNESYGILPVPTRSGYSFDGWWRTNNFASGTRVYDNDIVSIKEDIVFYAKWNPNSINVIYNPNGGECSKTNSSQAFGNKYTELPTPTRTGYVFAGWYTAATGGSLIDSNTIVNTLQEHTLYAHWTPNKFIIKLNVNGGTSSKTTVEVNYDGDYSALPTPTKVGHKFTGWYTAATGGTKYDVNAPVKLNGANGSEITFYAQWEVISYMVSFNANGGTTVSDKINVQFGTKYGTLPTTTRVGYTFNGWYDESGTKVTKDTVMKISNDSTLTAQWTAKSYTVTFVANGGKLSSTTATVIYDSKYGTLPTGTRNGYELTGWKDTYGNTITSDSLVKIDSAHSLTAQWKAITYTITYGEKNKQYTIETPDFVLDAPDEKVGYEFTGYTGEGLTTPTKTVTIKKGTYGDKKFETTWKAATGDAVEIVTLTKKTGISSNDFLDSNKSYTKVLNKDGSSKLASDLIKTGDILVDKNNKQTRIIISMDANGDGKVSTLDYAIVWNHLDKNHPYTLSTEDNKYNILAADVNSDGKVSTLDYVIIWNKLSNFKK